MGGELTLCRPDTCHAYDKATGAFCTEMVPEKRDAYCIDRESLSTWTGFWQLADTT